MSKLIVLDLCFRMAALMNQFDDAKNNGELHPSALVDGKSLFDAFLLIIILRIMHPKRIFRYC
jgi:hypothetical protein